MESPAIDPNHEAMLESMRRQARSSQVLKRHDDLRKQCEKEMSSYDKAKRLTAAQCRRSQIQHLNRMKTLLQQPRSYSSSSSSSPTDRHHSHISFQDAEATERRPSETLLDDVNDRRHTQLSLYDASKDGGRVSAAKGSGRKASRSVPSSAVSVKSTHSSSTWFTGRERFLFRVLWRNGKAVYIRDEQEARKSRQLLNGLDSDDCLVSL